LGNLKHSNSDLRIENENLIKENDKLRDKIERLKEKNKQENILKNLNNPENANDEYLNIANEELEEVINITLKLKRYSNNNFPSEKLS